jgi:hypothetical protein
MKKNLRNILALSLALMTTVSFAQDWDADSRTRIDMSGDGDEMSTDQRATLGVTWEGSDWGIHVSSDVNYTLGAGNVATMRVYEANASTDLMGYASLTAGRQALDYGSGAIMSSNQWGAVRSTWDGFTFGLDLDMADVTFGYASRSGEVFDSSGATNMWLNASKGEGDWNANLLYMSTTVGAADAMTAMGLDLSYEMMDGDLSLDVSYNTASNYATEDMDMTSIGATYQVNESMTVTGNQTAYGENGFNVGSASMGGYAASGSLGYLGANDEDLNIGITYNMGDFDLGATMHTITNSEDEDYARDVTDISLSYTMSDNANLSLSMVTDNLNDAETNYMWVTLNIRP